MKRSAFETLGHSARNAGLLAQRRAEMLADIDTREPLEAVLTAEPELAREAYDYKHPDGSCPRLVAS